MFCPLSFLDCVCGYKWSGLNSYIIIIYWDLLDFSIFTIHVKCLHYSRILTTANFTCIEASTLTSVKSTHISKHQQTSLSKRLLKGFSKNVICCVFQLLVKHFIQIKKNERFKILYFNLGCLTKNLGCKLVIHFGIQWLWIRNTYTSVYNYYLSWSFQTDMIIFCH